MAGVTAPRRWDTAPAILSFLLTVLLFLAVLFFSRPPNNAYPPTAINDFRRLCRFKPGSTVAYCSCAANQIQGGLPYEQFQSENMAILLGRGTPKIRALLNGCKKPRTPKSP